MRKKKKVLIVDDSNTVRRIIAKELEGAGYKVIEATNGKEALELSIEHHPDLITLDIEMPEMGGFETFRQLNLENYRSKFSHKKNGKIPVVFITSYDNIEDRNRGYELAATDFLTKPFPNGKLADTVNNILSPEAPLKGLTALIVDDSPIARTVLKDILKREGLTIIEADDGSKAVEIMEQMLEEVDVVLTDLSMPQMNGLEFCQYLRNELEMEDLPVIFLTAASDHSSLLEVFKAGGTDYLVKPFVKEELIARISVHLERMLLTKMLRDTVKSLKAANEEIHHLSITDALTGCYNHGYMTKHLEEEIKKSYRHNKSCSVIMCDIDFFKKINDTYGHQVGDEILKKFVQRLRESINEGKDWVARYGGEEFMFVMPQTDVMEAVMTAEKMKLSLTEKPIIANDMELKVTASFGVAGFDGRDKAIHMTYKELIKHADSLLYRAKREGRNQVQADF